MQTELKDKKKYEQWCAKRQNHCIENIQNLLLPFKTWWIEDVRSKEPRDDKEPTAES